MYTLLVINVDILKYPELRFFFPNTFGYLTRRKCCKTAAFFVEFFRVRFTWTSRRCLLIDSGITLLATSLEKSSL